MPSAPRVAGSHLACKIYNPPRFRNHAVLCLLQARRHPALTVGLALGYNSFSMSHSVLLVREFLEDTSEVLDDFST